MFQYSAMKEYTDSLMSVCNPVEYLECYMRTPQLEMLVKMHLIGVAEKLIKCQYGIIEDETATRPDEFLGIRKEKLKLLIKEKRRHRSAEGSADGKETRGELDR